MPTLSDTDKRIGVVRITQFFTNGRDLVYYVQGREHITKLNEGAFGRQCFTGPLFGCPVMTIQLASVISEAIEYSDSGGKVWRLTSHMEGVKWRYFFETGRVLWDRLALDKYKMKALQEDFAEEMKQQKESASGAPGED
jgi:hypothetical protein